MIATTTAAEAAGDGSLAIRARYVFPIDGPPLRDACLTMQGGRIVALGAPASSRVVDLGQVALLPALINAHTHLEFSCLERPLGAAGLAFPEWIRAVIAWRHGQRQAGGGTDAWRDAALQAGLDESRRAGVGALGEIATLPVDPVSRYANLAGVAFLELLGFRSETHADLLASAERFVDGMRTITGVRPGLSPHAPYTVPPRLLERIVKLAVRRRLPVAMHLAETRDELELLAMASGPLWQFLHDLGAWQEGALPRGARPLHYLNTLAEVERVLVIHGNYLDEEEVEFLSQRRDRMSLVYCPRTHAYFGHPAYPLQRLLAAGVRVVVGTDSRASNPDLSVLSELRHLGRSHPSVAPEDVLRMATREAAVALGVDDQCGSLTVGKRADLVVLPIEAAEPADPYQLILASTRRISAVYAAGRRTEVAPS